MPITTLSSRELHQDAGKAKKAAKKGPVFITDRGRATHVLLNIDEYQKLASKGKSIAELLRMPNDTPRFDFDFEELRSISPREVDFD